MNKDELYQTVLEGIAHYRQDPFVEDVAHALRRHPEPQLALSLNKNQLRSKGWLLRELRRLHPKPLGTVYVLGGWHGVLAAMLLADGGSEVERVVSFDLDPSCEVIARALNQRHVDNGRFLAVTRDVAELDYRADRVPLTSDAGRLRMLTVKPDLVINTSCEHFNEFPAWYARLPHGMLLALQSNDFFHCEEHLNCVADLAAFQRQAPMSKLLGASSLPLKRYTRFMLIGRR